MATGPDPSRAGSNRRAGADRRAGRGPRQLPYRPADIRSGAAPVPFVFGVHCHQPVGNLETVFEDATRLAYRPILEVLSSHPGVKVALHLSGPLCEWLSAHHPDVLNTVEVLAQRGQVEVLTSAFYEPVLTVIPEADRIGQIEMMTDFLRNTLSVRPSGAWLTERVWEPHLVASLARAGVRWAPIDDHHLLAAGLAHEDLGGSYLTEDEGLGLRLLPISSELRYAIPYESPEQVLDRIVGLGRARGGAVCFFDDGEKFGLWPGSHDHVYGERWLHRLCEKLESDPRVVTLLPDQLMHGRAQGRIYVPAACTREMSGWALRPERAKLYGRALQELTERGPPGADAFVTGGHWRNFLVRYPEANHLQKRTTRLSRQLQEANFPRGHRLARAARRGLYRAQCNCAYWHGVFGGIYLRHLRHALWSSLIRAESTYLACQTSAAVGLRAEIFDLEVDGGDEVLVEGMDVGAWVKPDYSGALLALDLRDPPFPLLNTMARHPEAYHLDEKLPEGVHFDKHRRLGLLDRFYAGSPSAAELVRGGGIEAEIGTPMSRRVGQKAGRIYVRMERQERLEPPGAEPLDIGVVKTLHFAAEGVTVQAEWTFSNDSTAAVSFTFAPELNLALLRLPEKLERARVGDQEFALDAPVDLPEANQVVIPSVAEGVTVRVSSTAPFIARSYPIETFSKNEAGFERLRQGLCLQPGFAVDLPAGGSASLSLKLELLRYGEETAGT